MSTAAPIPHACPTCNGAPIVVPATARTWLVVCQACGREGPTGETQEQAIVRWNWYARR